MAGSPILQTDAGQKQATHTRWWMLLLGMLTYGAFYTGRQNFGIAAAAMRYELHLTAVQIGTISGSMLIAYAIGSVVSGFLSDKVDPRRVVFFGALASLLLNWAASSATSFMGAMLPWALNGFAQALGWAPCSRLVTSWFSPSRRGSVFGIVLFAAGMASLATYALSLLSLQYFGWRAVFRFPVLSLIPMLCLFLVFARPGKEHPIADGTASTDSLMSHYKPLLRNPRFLALCGSIGCESLARYGLLIWVPIHLLGDSWRTSSVGHWLILALPLGMALGAVVTGVVSDRAFHKNRVITIPVLMALGSLLVGALYFVPKTGVVASCLLLLLAGFAVYGPQATYWTLGMEAGGKQRGSTAVGMMDSAAYVFAAVGERLIGSVVDRTGTTASIYPTIAVACLVSAALALPSLKKKEELV